jgi:hypothetical protein
MAGARDLPVEALVRHHMQQPLVRRGLEQREKQREGERWRGLETYLSKRSCDTTCSSHWCAVALSRERSREREKDGGG